MLCGATLIARPIAEVEAELTHVRWLLQEVARWDASLAPQAARRTLAEFYRAQERLLAAAMGAPAVAPVAVAPSPVTPVAGPEAALAAPHVEPDAPLIEASLASAPRPPAPSSVAGPEQPLPPPLEAPRLPPPSFGPDPVPPRRAPPPRQPPPPPPPKVPAGPSAWERLWKPLLGESIGWFIGAFLILAGTFTFVADAWSGMSDTSRALTVFGLAVFWTLGFGGWAHMLSRREATRPASTVLWRIAAAVAPLATVALGPVITSAFIAWPLVLAWSAVAALLARKVARDAWREVDASRAVAESGVLAAGMGFATFVLGAAPALASPVAGWLGLVPVALAAVAWRHGPVEGPRSATLTRFALASMGYAAALVVVRLHVALLALHVEPWGVGAVALSGFAAVALELRPRSTRAADAMSVLVVAGQSLVLAPAAFSPAPSMVLAALLAMVTTARLARAGMGEVEVKAARWLGPAYAFGYVAFQRVDQLVPRLVIDWFHQLEAWLGYASTPMPPSYDSVFASLFVVGVGLFAGFGLDRARTDGQRARSSVLLTCTTWGAVGFGGLAIVSLPTDVRPALLTLPVLLVTTLALSFWHSRADLARASAVLAVATGASFLQAWGEAWPVALLALGAAVLSVPARKPQREAYSFTAVVLVVFSVVAACVDAPHASQGLALVLATAAALLVARNLDSRPLLTLASGIPLLLVVRFGAPWLMSGVAIAGLGLLPSKARRDSRSVTLWPVIAAAALWAPLWEATKHDGWPSLTLALGAVALVGAARRLLAADLARGWRGLLEGVGLTFVLAALVPASWQFPWYQPWQAPWVSAVLALGCSAHAVWKERSWQGVMLAAGAVLLALGCLPFVHDAQASALVASVTVVLATGALLASVTVPLAAALWVGAWSDRPTLLLLPAVALSVVALFEEFDLTWKVLLNRSRVAWAASLSAAALVFAAIVLKGDVGLIALVTAALALVWARATGEGAQLGLGLLLFTANGLRALGNVPDGDGTAPMALAVLLAPALALVYGRGVLGLARVSAWFRLKGRGAHGVLLTSALVSSLTTMAALRGGTLPLEWVGAGWVVSLVLLGGPAAGLNLIGAALVAAFVPTLMVPCVVGLLVVALVAHHAPEQTRRVLGTESMEFLVSIGTSSAVALSLFGAAVHGGVALQFALVGSLFVAGLLLALAPLVSLAVFAAGVDVHAAVTQVNVPLQPWALAVALAAAAAAMALRLDPVARPFTAAWRVLGPELPTKASTPWWWGAAGLVLVCLPQSVSPWWGLVVALLLVTPSRLEVSVSFGLGAALAVLTVPHEEAGLALGLTGAVFAWLGALREGRERVARAWFHGGWAMSLLSLAVVGGQLEHVPVALTWSLAAVTCWAVVKAQPEAEWIGWSGTWLASHVVVAHVGLVLATGAPKELVLPWFGLVSSVLCLVALLRSTAPSRGAGLVLGTVAMVEVFVALSLLDTPHVREAFVALAAGLVVLIGTGRRAVLHDDGPAAWLGQSVVVVTVVALRRLGAGEAPGVLESWAALTWGPVLWGLARFLGREKRPEVSRALRGGAVVWPLVGLACAPWGTPSQLVLLLLVQAGHYAFLARTGLRRTGATLSAVAFNGAMVAAFFATGWHGVQDLALPLGLSIIALTRAFRDELGRDTQVRLRSVAMTAVYAAAAWRPLTFTTAWGLVFCVVVCVAGVAAGALLRIRSFVMLGTTFLVASVLATLIRQGLSEPKLGAALLAALGVGIVAFMVLFTTKRSELQARVAALQAMLATWEG